jgi:polysaccharide biosynthesis protein PslG
VPCWNVRESQRECMERGSPGSPDPPADLGPNGSPSFNAFVYAVTKHCSPSGHCVKDYIKYFEMWNEPNTPRYWNGTVEQLYDMAKPAAAIIRANVPGVLISTPAPFQAVNPDWMDQWLNLENTKGRISDIYGIHGYIGPGDKWITDNAAPEERFLDMIVPMVEKKNKAGWNSTPWMNTETGFLGSGPYDCPLNKGATDAICDAYLVRWFVMQFAYGAEHIDWYWFTLIGRQDETYSQVMHWLLGSHFTGACTHDGPTVECPLTQANGRNAVIVWNATSDCTGNNCGTTTSYNVKGDFHSIRDLSGKTTPVPANRVVAIGAMPVMIAAN